LYAMRSIHAAQGNYKDLEGRIVAQI